MVGTPPEPSSTQAHLMVVVRRGSAVAMYGAFGEVGPVTAASTADLERQARLMAARLCRYTVAGC